MPATEPASTGGGDRPVPRGLDANAPDGGGDTGQPRGRTPASTLADAGPRPAPSPPEVEAQAVTVAKGDSLSVIFKRLGLPQADLMRLLKAGERAKVLARLKPGQNLMIQRDANGSMRELTLHEDAASAIRFTRGRDGFTSEPLETVLETRRLSAFGVVTSSLFLAGQKAGLTDKMIMQLAEIFGWDIDFALDLRTGDRFSIVYEAFYKGEDRVKNGEILAAGFVNQGKSIQAVRYTDRREQNRYYTPDGQSMRKAFLRAPVKFSRISSRFSQARRHPVLSTVRAHRGVDYAAPMGTPIRATGDGKISFVGRNGGYGKSIIVRHGGIYKTVYAHMSRFAKGARVGRNVSQRDIIGYVGQTGLATGPHVHYEFRVRGVHRNPLTVRIPRAAPIAERNRADFLAQARPLLSQLELLSRTSVASK